MTKITRIDLSSPANTLATTLLALAQTWPEGTLQSLTLEEAHAILNGLASKNTIERRFALDIFSYLYGRAVQVSAMLEQMNAPVSAEFDTNNGHIYNNGQDLTDLYEQMEVSVKAFMEASVQTIEIMATQNELITKQADEIAKLREMLIEELEDEEGADEPVEAAPTASTFDEQFYAALKEAFPDAEIHKLELRPKKQETQGFSGGFAFLNELVKQSGVGRPGPELA